MYSFHVEIKNVTQSFRHVEPQDKNFLLPSHLKNIADTQLPGKQMRTVLYGDRDRAAQVIYAGGSENYYYTVFLNPYTGEVLKVKNMNTDFFNFVLKGHFYLWLPAAIGHPITVAGTVIFILMLLTGIFLWWPRNRRVARQRFMVKWNARWRRRNYDLHSVLGFYISWFAIIIALTGLVWSFNWFNNIVYRIASGGKAYKQYRQPVSDTINLLVHNDHLPSVDRIWLKIISEHPEAKKIEVQFPLNATSSILTIINNDDFTSWKSDYRFFDQNSLKELSVDHTWGRLKDASGADKLIRMNYDIHVGAILGFPGKCIAFMASLLVASLPFTGVILLIGRINKKKII
jgi:uncharacterized iron-regulated membrane protein